MVSLRHPMMAEGAWSSSGARQRLSRPLQFAHLRVEHQVNGVLGCDYNISIGQRGKYSAMIRGALQSTRLVTNTAEVPGNAACSQLTTRRTFPSPGMRTASVNVQEVLSRTVTARYAVDGMSGTRSSTEIWGPSSRRGFPVVSLRTKLLVSRLRFFFRS